MFLDITVIYFSFSLTEIYERTLGFSLCVQIVHPWGFRKTTKDVNKLHSYFGFLHLLTSFPIIVFLKWPARWHKW